MHIIIHARVKNSDGTIDTSNAYIYIAQKLNYHAVCIKH